MYGVGVGGKEEVTGQSRGSNGGRRKMDKKQEWIMMDKNPLLTTHIEQEESAALWSTQPNHHQPAYQPATKRPTVCAVNE